MTNLNPSVADQPHAQAGHARWRPSSRLVARVHLCLVIVAASTAIGMGYWSILAAVYGIDDRGVALLHGGLYGVTIGGGLATFQVFYMASAASLPLRRVPFLTGLLVRTVIAALIIVVALAFCRLTFESPLDRRSLYLFDLARDTLFSVGVYVAVSFVVMMQRIIGGRVLRNFVIGRYHRPVREDRVFLFLDLADSTALARTLGDIGVHALISRLFFDIDDVILRYGGEVHRYIGDEVVVTWPLADGVEGGRCLACYHAIQALIAARADSYRAEFGVVPVFRAGLHGGPVVAGECGDSKQEIVYFGDTINIAARLRSACKEFGVRLLVSEDLVRAMGARHRSAAFSLDPLGYVRLAGRSTDLQVFASRSPEGLGA
ncbi:MAG: adenylate/guanylate cyclase domain-containing protein [Rhodospirillales bacterium]|nr:MAG: adenylate/guanylate cyclase domain-containing protein [Rhodospirillales bacterium]